ncbi:MAG: hypothetical protein H3C63_17545, partial [Candidatus Omnitrophica bacterium]|nr:hypothetical protein [Candidatus Omnitrophota bacterium]
MGQFTPRESDAYDPGETPNLRGGLREEPTKTFKEPEAVEPVSIGSLDKGNIVTWGGDKSYEIVDYNGKNHVLVRDVDGQEQWVSVRTPVRLVATSWRDATESAIRDVAQRSSDSPTTETPIAQPTKIFKEPESAIQSGSPINRVAYHGAEVDIDAFDPTFIGSQQGGKGPSGAFWFTTDPVGVESYGHIVHQVELNLSNPMVVTRQDRDNSDYGLSDFVAIARERGHDGVVFTDIYDGGATGDTFAVFNPDAIRVVGKADTSAGEAISPSPTTETPVAEPTKTVNAPDQPDVRQMSEDETNSLVIGQKGRTAILAPIVGETDKAVKYRVRFVNPKAKRG